MLAIQIVIGYTYVIVYELCDQHIEKVSLQGKSFNQK